MVPPYGDKTSLGHGSCGDIDVLSCICAGAGGREGCKHLARAEGERGAVGGKGERTWLARGRAHLAQGCSHLA